MRKFQNLVVWQKAHQLTVAIYKITDSFPTTERYGLIPQIRRASVSIASNISEGCSRKTDRDFCRFLEISLGSGYEVEYQLLLAKDLTYLSEEDYRPLNKLTEEINKMLNKFISTLSKN